MKESQSLSGRKVPRKFWNECRTRRLSTMCQKLRESERNFARISNPLFQTRSFHFVISIRAVIRLVYPAGRGIVVPVVLVLFSRGRARRDGARQRKSERAAGTSCHTEILFLEIWFIVICPRLYGPPSVSCSEMPVEESEIDTTRRAPTLSLALLRARWCTVRGGLTHSNRVL